MSNQSSNIRAAEPPPEKKVSDGIERAYRTYGSNLALFFNAVMEEIKAGERKSAPQGPLPLTKSR
jgi:hypothetical protein